MATLLFSSVFTLKHQGFQTLVLSKEYKSHLETNWVKDTSAGWNRGKSISLFAGRKRWAASVSCVAIDLRVWLMKLLPGGGIHECRPSMALVDAFKCSEVEPFFLPLHLSLDILTMSNYSRVVSLWLQPTYCKKLILMLLIVISSKKKLWYSSNCYKHFQI